MSNEVLFILQSLVLLSFALFAFRMGRAWLIGFLAVNVVLMNIFVLKQMTLFGLAATGGNVLYASVFLCTDLLCEHYGKKEALKAVRIGFFVSVVFVVMSQFILNFAPNDWDFAQGAFETIFTLSPRIVAASMATYLVAQHLDVYIFDKIKRATRGRMLWLRNNASTMVSQFVDSAMFTMLAFYGVPGFEAIFQIIIFTWIIKIIVAVLDTPFMYLSKVVGHAGDRD
ncbi:MAG: queuosine precursor transporter [Patescibacteria group bacterium]|nr:queuosine precursor transporter [Patescibacteria group bacterium]